jgi:hypothetical protein
VGLELGEEGLGCCFGRCAITNGEEYDHSHNSSNYDDNNGDNNGDGDDVIIIIVSRESSSRGFVDIA